MEYEEIQHIISKVLTDTASEEETKVFYTWLKSDEENKKFYFEIKKIFDTRKAIAFSNPERLKSSWEALSQKIDERTLKERNLTRRLFIRYASAAAAILFILATTLFFVMNNKSDGRWVEVYNEPGNAPKTVALEDGSEVKLNAASVLKYPKHFSGRKREVHLEGEALFSVVRNEKKPFVVYSDLQEITVLGTIFNVNSYLSSINSETTLISGKVRLSIKDKMGQLQHEIVLSENQQVRLNKETLESELKSIDSQNIISWTNNEYIFKNKSFGEILERLSAIYDVTFVATSGQKDQKYTCKFSVGQSLDDILAILNFKDQFRYIKGNDTITITDK